jgi:hypothetical protein
MNTGTIEYSGGSSWGRTAEQVRLKTRNAPRWWLDRAGLHGRAAAPAATAKRARRVIGWIGGTCCPGVSVPAFSASDRRTLPEQFTPAAWRAMLRQSHGGKRPVRLTWGHGGDTIAASTGLDVLFRLHPTFGELIGLEFEARLYDDEIGRRVLAEGADGLGVSIGYHSVRQWHVERDGIGTVRVVDDAVLDHVAVLPRSSTLGPCFKAARCYAAPGGELTCPTNIRTKPQLEAYAVLKRQAGCRT